MHYYQADCVSFSRDRDPAAMGAIASQVKVVVVVVVGGRHGGRGLLIVILYYILQSVFYISL